MGGGLSTGGESKTREMVIDLRKKRNAPQPLSILGEVMEVVEDYRYLGAIGVAKGWLRDWLETGHDGGCGGGGDPAQPLQQRSSFSKRPIQLRCHKDRQR